MPFLLESRDRCQLRSSINQSSVVVLTVRSVVITTTILCVCVCWCASAPSVINNSNLCCPDGQQSLTPRSEKKTVVSLGLTYLLDGFIYASQNKDEVTTKHRGTPKPQSQCYHSGSRMGSWNFLLFAAVLRPSRLRNKPLAWNGWHE